MARAALEHDLTLAAAVLQADPGPAAILDPEGTVLIANAAFSACFTQGFQTDALRRSLRVSLGTSGPLPCSLRRADGTVDRGQVTGLNAGDRRLALLRVRTDDQEQAFQTVTERLNRLNAAASRRSRTESMLGHVMNATVEGILVADMLGQVMEQNAALVQMLGPVKHLDDLFPNGRWRLIPRSDGATSGTVDAVHFTRPSGEELVALVNVGVSRAVDQILYVLVFHDVTDRHRLEMARSKAEDSDRQLRIAQLRDEAKNRFLSVVSHELRTPLHGVISALDLMRQNGSADPAQAELLDIAVQSGEAALDQVNRILEITRVESRIGSDLAQNLFDPAEKMAGLVRESSALAARHSNQLTLTVSGLSGTQVVGDAYLFRQIAQNLVGNALKFTRNGRVDVTLHLTPAPGDQIKVDLSVVDTGVGFDLSQVDRLLQEFETGNDRYSRIEDGAGLGLALVRRAVERMSGDLIIDSAPGKGSSFLVSLMLGRGAETKNIGPADVPPKPPAEAPASYPLDILVADDVDVNREVLRRLLDRYGCKITVAEDGCEALTLLSGQPFDLVFMDVSMPRMDGIEATRRFRETTPQTATIVVGVTAHSDEDTRRLCLEAGMQDVVVKPFRRDRMEAFLRDCHHAKTVPSIHPT